MKFSVFYNGHNWANVYALRKNMLSAIRSYERSFHDNDIIDSALGISAEQLWWRIIALSDLNSLLGHMHSKKYAHLPLSFALCHRLLVIK